MTIDVSIAIDPDTSELVSVIRSTAGAYVDGLYVAGVETLIPNVPVSIQSPTPAEVSQMPEAERNRDIKKFISQSELLIDDDRINQTGDNVVFRGFNYKLIKASDYSSYGYTRAFGARVE